MRFNQVATMQTTAALTLESVLLIVRVGRFVVAFNYYSWTIFLIAFPAFISCMRPINERAKQLHFCLTDKSFTQPNRVHSLCVYRNGRKCVWQKCILYKLMRCKTVRQLSQVIHYGHFHKPLEPWINDVFTLPTFWFWIWQQHILRIHFLFDVSVSIHWSTHWIDMHSDEYNLYCRLKR